MDSTILIVGFIVMIVGGFILKNVFKLIKLAVVVGVCVCAYYTYKGNLPDILIQFRDCITNL